MEKGLSGHSPYFTFTEIYPQPGTLRRIERGTFIGFPPL
jgi:hypothetical protein